MILINYLEKLFNSVQHTHDIAGNASHGSQAAMGGLYIFILIGLILGSILDIYETRRERRHTSYNRHDLSRLKQRVNLNIPSYDCDANKLIREFSTKLNDVDSKYAMCVIEQFISGLDNKGIEIMRQYLDTIPMTPYLKHYLKYQLNRREFYNNECFQHSHTK